MKLPCRNLIFLKQIFTYRGRELILRTRKCFPRSRGRSHNTVIAMTTNTFIPAPLVLWKPQSCKWSSSCLYEPQLIFLNEKENRRKLHLLFLWPPLFFYIITDDQNGCFYRGELNLKKKKKTFSIHVYTKTVESVSVHVF